MPVALAMIAKNEAQVIARALESVRDLIDYWVVCDTGSTDETPAIVQRVLAGIPGELIHRPWLNFEHNRNEALDLARPHAEYLLVLDADDFVERAPDFDRGQLRTLRAEGYYLQHSLGGVDYPRVALLKSSAKWRYDGVVHEVLICESHHVIENFTGLAVRCVGGGARSQDPDRFIRDAEVLERELEKNPRHTRHAFYLARSYHCANRFERAERAYERRVELGGWDEEVFYSLFQLGLVRAALGRPFEEIEKSLLRAYESCPRRAEPLTELAERCRHLGKHALAVLYARQAAAIPRPLNGLFISAADYAWRARDELSISLYYLGQYTESLAICCDLLKSAPPEQRPRIEANQRYAEQALGIKAPDPASAPSAKYHVAMPTPDNYRHDAFREVAENLQLGIERLGERCTLGPDYAADATNIVFGPNVVAAFKMPEPPAGSILYNLEQVSPESAWFTPAYCALLKRHRVWDYDEDNAAALRELGIDVEAVLPVRCAPEVSRIKRAAKRDVDVVFAGSLNERRESLIAELRARGLHVEVLFGKYGAERDAVIARAKLAVNVHFYESAIFESVRVSYLLASGIPVVSEVSRGGEAFASAVKFAPYAELASECARLVSNQVELARMSVLGLQLARTERVDGVLRRLLAPRARVVVLYRVKNEARWIEESLRRSLEVADRAIVLDDHSTDRTAEIAGSIERVEVIRNPHEGVDEARDYQTLFDAARAHQPDWVLFLDGDEVLTHAAVSECQEIVSGKTGGAWSFRINYLWDAPSMERVDGVYAAIHQPRLFSLFDQDRAELRYAGTERPANLHCSKLPSGFRGEIHQPARGSVKHYGYMQDADRRQKHQFYNEIDPGNDFEGRYAHVVGEPDRWCPGPIELRPFADQAAEPSVCLVVLGRDEESLRQFSLEHVRVKELRLIANPDGKLGGTAAIGNRILDATSADIVAVVHPDVHFGPGSIAALAHGAAAGAVTGIVGRSLAAEYVWCTEISRSTAVSTLDSCAVFLPRRRGLRFDEREFDGFHCAVEDLCLQAKVLGMPAVVPVANATHLAHGETASPRSAAWRADYRRYREKLTSKWPGVAFTTT